MVHEAMFLRAYQPQQSFWMSQDYTHEPACENEGVLYHLVLIDSLAVSPIHHPWCTGNRGYDVPKIGAMMVCKQLSWYLFLHSRPEIAHECIFVNLSRMMLGRMYPETYTQHPHLMRTAEVKPPVWKAAVWENTTKMQLLPAKTPRPILTGKKKEK